MTTNEIATRPVAGAVAPATYPEALQVAATLAQSGYFADARSGAQAAAKVIAGMELGIGPMAAMTGIHIVQGRVTLGANLIAAAIKASGRYSYRVTQMDAEAVSIDFTEHGQTIGTATFTKADAQAAGLWGKTGPWKQHPRNMLFARAISNGAKWFCPDVFTGPVYTPEELGAVVDGETGDVISIPDTPPADTQPPSVAEVRARELIGLYGRDRVIGVMRDAGITSTDLADDDTWTRAQALFTVDPDTGEVTDNPASTGEPSGVISEAQRRRLEAIARELGRGHEWLSACARDAGWESTTLIPVDQYDAFEQALRTAAGAPVFGDE